MNDLNFGINWILGFLVCDYREVSVLKFFNIEITILFYAWMSGYSNVWNLIFFHVLELDILM